MRILLLSYHLYPNGTAEGLCVAKLARTLTDAGHAVTILTSTLNTWSGTVVIPDTGLLAGIPIHRVAPQTTGWVGRLQRGHERLLRAGRQAGLRRVGVSALDAAINIALGCTPVEYAWVPAAAVVAQRLGAGGARFDVLHSRLNHFLSHRAALRVAHQQPTLPWCAHFSDPWPGQLYPGAYRQTPTRSGLMERRQLGILNAILARADSVTVPSVRLLPLLLAGPRARYHGKAHAIPHLGNFWEAAPSYQPGAVLELLHAGSILAQRNPTTLLQAVALLRDQTPDLAAQLRVTFVGHANPFVDGAVATYGLADTVRTIPYTDFAELWALTCRADVLLLLESPMAEGVFMPSKLADYLSARRPILALSPAVGTVADYLAGGGGLRVDPTDPPAIAAALRDLLTRRQTGQLAALEPPPELVARVSPAWVGPAYAAAFAHAQAGRGRGVR